MAESSTPDLTHEQLLQEYQAGISATLRSWSVLKTAVESGWGGANSQEKAEFLRQSLYDHLCVLQPMDATDLEDALAIYMEEEFSVTLEDDSEKQISSLLLRMHQECFVKKNPLMCRQVVMSATQASQQLSAIPAQIQESEHDDDDDNDDEMEDQDLSLSMVAQSLFGSGMMAKPTVTPEQPVRQLGEPEAEREHPELDDDGFAPVVSTKKKKKSS